MKIKRLLVVLPFIVLFFLVVSNKSISYASSDLEKKTPPGQMKTPGQVKTPGAMATQNALNHEVGVYGNPHGQPVNYQGMILLVDATAITLQLNDGTILSISLSADTEIHLPKGRAGEQTGLVPGMLVMVHATSEQDGTFSCRAVQWIPTSVDPLPVDPLPEIEE